MVQSVANHLLNRLSDWGVTEIYGYPGDSINGLISELGRMQDGPRFVQSRHEEDVAQFNPPPEELLAQAEHAFLVTSGDEVVGVVLSRPGDADGEQQVVLDYVLPPYRDFTPGEFVFRADGPFAEMGARRVVASPAMTASERYLAAVGFVPDDAGRRVLHLAGAARPEG